MIPFGSRSWTWHQGLLLLSVASHFPGPSVPGGKVFGDCDRKESYRCVKVLLSCIFVYRTRVLEEELGLVFGLSG